MEMNEIRYSSHDEWVKKIGDNKIQFGISNYAQDKLGDIVFVEMPEVDQEVEKDESLINVESVKAVAEVFSPVNGKIIAINEAIDDTPEMINESAEEKGWLLEIEFENESDLDGLMNKSDYDKSKEE